MVVVIQLSPWAVKILVLSLGVYLLLLMSKLSSMHSGGLKSHSGERSDRYRKTCGWKGNERRHTKAGWAERAAGGGRGGGVLTREIINLTKADQQKLKLTTRYLLLVCRGVCLPAVFSIKILCKNTKQIRKEFACKIAWRKKNSSNSLSLEF